MTSEHKIQNDIRIALSRHQCTVFRVNVGSVKTPTGRPRQDQIQFHHMLTSHGIVHGIARSPEDAIKIVDEGLVGYGFKDYEGSN